MFPALTRDNVTLVKRSVAAVNERGVIDTDGVEYPADVIVMATGFQPWNFLATLKLVGRGGREIHGAWGDTARSVSRAFKWPGFRTSS